MKWIAFLFMDTPQASRIHVVGWNVRRERWEVPCGLWTPEGMRPTALDKPLCLTCARLTAQLDPLEVDR